MDSETIKILAVDDDDVNLISLKTLLIDLIPHSEVYTASGGEAGIRLAAEEDPDVILLDIFLPDMDGFDVCKILKSDNKLSFIPVVFTTALSIDRESRIRAIDCGAEAYFSWPMDKTELVAHLNAMVRKKAANVGKRKENERLSKLLEERTSELNLIRKLNQVLEQRVIDHTTQLEATNKEIEAFTYSISHDLRTPLRHINGFADVLKSEFSKDLPEIANKYLDKIAGSAIKMSGLIDDLLSFLRTGSLKFKKITLSMNEILEDALQQIKPFVKDRQIEWSIASLPEVYGNYDLLLQVWINLLDNAVKYTRSREKAIIIVNHWIESREIVFCIQDNGVGFDMEYATKLFGVFQRMHLAEQFEGTGIGLANVRKIISRHGGRTWADAEVEKGAKFYFSLPVYQESTGI
jgi:two-component system, sensor histidine kinase and response regulator